MTREFVWVHKGLRKSPCMRAMEMRERVVYYHLLEHAAQQVDDGSFDDSDRLALAHLVAHGAGITDEAALDTAIDTMLEYGVLERRAPSVLRFTHWWESQNHEFLMEMEARA